MEGSGMRDQATGGLCCAVSNQPRRVNSSALPAAPRQFVGPARRAASMHARVGSVRGEIARAGARGFAHRQVDAAAVAGA